MSKLTLTNLSNLGGNPATAQTAINSNNDAIEVAVQDTLSRSGLTPNQMDSNLDMNGHTVTNLGSPVNSTDAVRYQDIFSSFSSITSITAPSVVGNSGKVLGTDGASVFWRDVGSALAPLHYDRTNSEISAGVTPVNYNFLPGDIRRYGGIGDGLTDNTTAINNAYAALPDRGVLYFPAGIYFYNTALVFAGQKRPTFIGEGSKVTLIAYNGANKTNDCITIGNGIAGESQWGISGITFYSNQVMTAGFGVHIKGMDRSRLEDVNFSAQDINSKFFNGVWFDGLDYVWLDGYQARASGTALRVNGVNGIGITGLYATNGKIGSSGIGVHVAGNVGGVEFAQTDIINNGTNVLIDAAFGGAHNREITFQTGCSVDSACTTHDAATFDGINMDIQDTDCSIFFKDSWNASASTLIRIGSSFAGTLFLMGGYLYNAFNTFGGPGYGIDISSAATVILVDGTFFRNCQGAGIISSVPTTNVYLNDPLFDGNVVNPISSNIAASGKTTYQAQHISNLGRLAVGAQSSFASSVSGVPLQFYVAGNAHALQSWSAGVGNPWLSLGHSRGATPGTHVALQVGDQLGGISFEGSDGTAFRTGAQIQSNCSVVPSGSQITANLLFKTNDGTGIAVKKTLNGVGDLTNSAGATAMTAGFICIPSAAGVPTGVPAVAAGNVPLYWDSTNLQLYVYTGAAWKKSAAFT